MQKRAVKLLAFLAVAVVIATATAVISGATRWFFEDANSFSLNTAKRWAYPPGFATVADNRINYGLGSSDDGTLVYTTPTATSDDYLISELDYKFEWLDSPGRDADGGYIGIHLVAGPGEDDEHPVFEVLDTFNGENVWRTTSVSAATGVVYTIRVEVNLKRGYEIAKYTFRPSGSSADFSTIANVMLPAGTIKPKSLNFCGRGSLGSVEMATKAAAEDTVSRYRRWAELDEILTWRGTSSSTFKEFLFTNDTWQAGAKTYSGSAAEVRFANAALQFVSGISPTTFTASSAALNVGGLIVEPTASGYSLSVPGSIVFGDTTGKLASWYSIENGFSVKATSGTITFKGEANMYVKSGVTLDLSNATAVELDDSTYGALRLSGGGVIKLPSAGLDATGAVVIDYSGCDSTSAAATMLQGNIKIDDSTSFVLPDGIAAGTQVQLCTGSVTGGGSGAVKRSITVGGVSFAADVTISGNKLTYQKRSYATTWKNYKGMFTWAGTGDSFENGAFATFNVTSGSDTSTVYDGAAAASGVPGWEGLTVPCFNWIFSAMTRTTNSMSLVLDPGYALRFTSTGYRGDIYSDTKYLSLGGLLVDSGATGCSLNSLTDDQTSFLVVGDYAGKKTNRVEISENFSVGRFGSVAVVGTTQLEVPGGRTFSVDGGGRSAGTGFPDYFPELHVSGSGTLKCNLLRAGGPSTINFSALSASTSIPFVDGALELDDQTRIVFPSGLAAGTKFPLCTGSLTASDGIRAVALGAGEFSLKNVTFDYTNKKASYAELSSVKKVSLNASGANWSTLNIPDGSVVEITLTANSWLTFDTPANLSALLVKGKYQLWLGAVKPFDPGRMFLGCGTVCYLQYRNNSTAFAQETFTADNSLPVQFTAIKGDSASPYFIVTNRVSVTGGLWIRDKVFLSNPDNSFDSQCHLQVESGGRCVLNGGRLHGCRIDVYGELCAMSNDVSFGSDVRINLYKGASMTTSGGAKMRFDDTATITVKSSSGSGTGSISAETVFDAPVALLVESGMTLAMSAAESTLSRETLAAAFGKGALSLTGNSVVAFDAGSFTLNGATGNGTAAFFDDPSGVVSTIFPASWYGICRLIGTELVDFNPSKLGNAHSSICYEGAHGYFAKNASYTPLTILSVPEDLAPALTIDHGYDEQAIDLGSPSGSGELYLMESGNDLDYRVFLQDVTAYTGSISVEGEDSGNGVAIGFDPASESDLATAFETTYRGSISLFRDEATIGEDSVWTAAKGIYLASSTRLTDSGLINSYVRGSGTVRYTGEVGADRIETDIAKYNDVLNWAGTVQIDKATISGFDIVNCGNENSMLEFREAVGYLPNNIVVPFPVKLSLNDSEGGLEINAAEWQGRYEFSKLIGDGMLRLTYGMDGDASCYRVMDIGDFEGKIRMNTYSGSLVLGDVEPEEFGAIEVADGFTIKANRDWETPRAIFHENLTVDGVEGDNVFKIVGEDTDVSGVNVSLTGSPDPHIQHSLAYDGITSYIYVKAASTPPSAKIVSCRAYYGVDLAKAGVQFTVSDWWTGYDFEGRVIAEVVARDSTGRVVGYGSCVLTGNGTYELNDMELPPGCRGNYYDYEVVISTEDNRTGEITPTDGRAIVSADAVESIGSWINENAVTFAAREQPSGKSATGTWTLPGEGAAVATNGFISVDTSETGGRVKFTAAVADSNDVARIAVNLTIDSQVLNSIDELNAEGVPDGVRGAVSIVGTGDDEDIPGWAVWNPSAQEFVKAYANDGSTASGNHVICWTIYHRIGVISYTVDGLTLTNSSGSAVFPLRDSETEARAEGADFKGYIDVAALTGTQDTAKLARVVGADGMTNEYETVDEAVAAASNANDRVGLIWDASWRPTTNIVGRTFDFDLNGYHVYVDEATTNRIVTEGYRLIDNGNGSYTMGVVEYSITFLPNGGSGTMPNQIFSVTNMIVTLISNVFTDVGTEYSLDFSHWNMMSDGTGKENWSDGGVIDLSSYGLSDQTLYAQWKVSVRALTIEPADEYVYLELVTTNGVEHKNVRYVSHTDPEEAKKGRGSAIVPIEYGSNVKLTFSTDLEYRLDWTETNIVKLIKAETLVYDRLPKLLALFSSVKKLAVDNWAAQNNVTPNMVASTYALVSCSLGLTHLATPQSEVSISDFKITEDGCAFKVAIDDEEIVNVDRILPLVLICDSLGSGWYHPSASQVKVGDDNSVEVTAGKGAFIKLDIPIN